MTMEAIKDAIQRLPEEQRTSLVAWLNDVEYDDWDKQMAKDFAPGGRGMRWVEEAHREVEAGSTSPIEEGFARRRRERS
jgi:hypothetical protein